MYTDPDFRRQSRVACLSFAALAVVCAAAALVFDWPFLMLAAMIFLVTSVIVAKDA